MHSGLVQGNVVKGSVMHGVVVQGSVHLRFKQAQPKMCRSPKVENGFEN